MKRFASIELSKEYLKFSAAHFTLFSAAKRERLHGHNFSVAASFRSPIGENGLCFDYGDFKKKLAAICNSLDEYMLLPGRSPHLQISQKSQFYLVKFNDEEMQFLVSDTLILPLLNISVEELADYILIQLLADNEIQDAEIDQIEVQVSSGPGQWGTRSWTTDQGTAEGG